MPTPPVAPARAGDELSRLLTEIAAGTGAADLFVFRRVSGDKFAHLGGAGRGRGWAGIVDLHPGEQPEHSGSGDDEGAGHRLRRSVGRRDHGPRTPRGTQVVARLSTSEPRAIFGPYWASAAVFVRLADDVMVVLGGGDGTLMTADDSTLVAAAEQASGLVDEVSPAKRLADELEMLHAVRELAHAPAGTVGEVLTSVTRIVATSLSCEVAIVLTRDGRMQVHEDGWTLPGSREELRAAMTALWRRWAGQPPECGQDAYASPLPPPVDPAGGVRAYYLLPVGSPAAALLLVLHTAAVPRGFTNLCRDLGVQLAGTADTLLSTALLREQLQREIDRVAADARVDPLTGVGNRLAWAESCTATQQRIGAGSQAGLIVVDLNDLKRANDTRGHPFGDQLITALARLVSGSVRASDLVARIGGDELAVLLGETTAEATAVAAGRIEAAVRDHPGLAGFPLSAALGWAHCPPGGELAASLRSADIRMYERKATMKAAT